MTSVYFTWHLQLWQCFSDMTSVFSWHQCISHNIYINDISVFHMTSTFINISAFSDMTSTFMTSVFFRHDIYIDDIRVFHSWHLYLWHQCFSDMTYTLWHQCFSDMTSILILLHLVFFRHDIYIDDISVFQTWHLHWWHQCFHMTSTLMTSVFFRHYTYIDGISVFHMTSTFMTSVFFRHDIYIHDISFFSDMTPTLIISVFFTWHLHYDITVFQTWHLQSWLQCF